MWQELYSLYFPKYKRWRCTEKALTASSLSEQSVASVSEFPPSCSKHSSHVVTSKLTKSWWTSRLTGWCWRYLIGPSLHVCDRVVPYTNVSDEGLVKLDYMKIAVQDAKYWDIKQFYLMPYPLCKIWKWCCRFGPSNTWEGVWETSLSSRSE